MNNGEIFATIRIIAMSEAAVDTVSGSERLRQALSALRHRNYRLYWFGQLSSVLAQNMEGVAQSWLVLELTDSPLLLGLTGLTFGRQHGDSRGAIPPGHSPLGTLTALVLSTLSIDNPNGREKSQEKIRRAA